MTQTNILEQAKQGDTKAILSLINKALEPKGITVQVSIKGKDSGEGGIDKCDIPGGISQLWKKICLLN